jgi:hypothetical protein
MSNVTCQSNQNQNRSVQSICPQTLNIPVRSKKKLSKSDVGSRSTYLNYCVCYHYDSENNIIQSDHFNNNDYEFSMHYQVEYPLHNTDLSNESD